MKKKIFLTLVILILLFTCGVIYFNKVILPLKIRSLIVEGIKGATHKEASFDSLYFSVFKGLVLKNLVIYDDKETFLKLEEFSCGFLIPPLFFKKIVIPSIKLKSLTVFLTRRPDNTLNIAQLLTPTETAPAPAQKKKFGVFIYKIAVMNSRVEFKDKTLPSEFSKTIDNLRLVLRLSPPAAVKFNLNFEIAGSPGIKVAAAGAYKMPQRELEAKAAIKDLSAQEFSAYYRDTGISFPQGAIDCLLDIKFKDKQLKFSGSAALAQLDISGLVDFKNSSLAMDVNFQYSGLNYKAQGSINNFKAPQVQLKLASQELSLDSNLQVAGRLVTFSKLDGRYLNSDFSLKGDIDAANPSSLQANIAGAANIDLRDLNEPLKKFKDTLEKIQLGGVVNAKINLSGNINDFKSCLIQANLSSPSLSVYGLKPENLSVDYRQENGLAALPLIRFSFYGGTVEAQANINLLSENLPYRMGVNIQDVKLEKLKLDTPVKEKDIAGNFKGEAKISGFYKEPNRLSGAGKISVSDGKLWELNLFKGLGRLLFARDFAAITIKEGSCDFLIRDEAIFTDNLKMKGEFIELSGVTKIGFDSSIDASVNVRVNDEMAPLSGSFKDVTTAILGQAGRFGVIKITGSLKEPKYKFHPVAFDMLKALKNTLFNK